MARLPQPGSDANVWGSILNDFLRLEHNDDGTLKIRATIQNKYDFPVGGIPETDLTPTVQTKLNSTATASTSSVGGIQLAGDLGGTATAPTVPALRDKVPITETVTTNSASGTAITISDIANTSIYYITLTANATITLPAAQPGQSFTIALKQDALGTRSITWPSSVKWPNGVAMQPTSSANAVDIISFLSVTAGTWFGFPAGFDLR